MGFFWRKSPRLCHEEQRGGERGGSCALSGHEAQAARDGISRSRDFGILQEEPRGLFTEMGIVKTPVGWLIGWVIILY